MLSPKSVLITGCNRGIGLEFVKHFLQLATPPTFLFAGCRNPDASQDLNEIAKKHSSVQVLQIDVTDQDTVEKAMVVVQSMVKEDGLNLLINNSGVLYRESIGEITRESMRHSYEVNTIGPLMIAQTFLPLLKQAASQQPDKPMSCNKSAIINVSSNAASITENTSGKMYPYRSSKVALNMISSTLGIDLKGDGVLCTSIHPGWVRTDMGGPNALVSTEESIRGMIAVMETLGEEGSGKFYHALKGDLMGW